MKFSITSDISCCVPNKHSAKQEEANLANFKNLFCFPTENEVHIYVCPVQATVETQ